MANRAHMTKRKATPSRPGVVDIVRLDYEEDESGLIYATSPDLPGLLVAEPDMDSLTREIPKVIQAMFKATYGMDVIAVPARDDGLSRP